MMRSRQPPVNWPSNRAIRCLIKFPGTWNAFFHGAMKWRVCWKFLGKKLVAVGCSSGSCVSSRVDL